MDSELEIYKNRLDMLQRQMELCSQFRAHELRAPLARILGLTQLAQLDEDAMSVKEMAALIESNAMEIDSAIKCIKSLMEECVDLTSNNNDCGYKKKPETKIVPLSRVLPKSMTK